MVAQLAIDYSEPYSYETMLIYARRAFIYIHTHTEDLELILYHRSQASKIIF